MEGIDHEARVRATGASSILIRDPIGLGREVGDEGHPVRIYAGGHDQNWAFLVDVHGATVH